MNLQLKHLLNQWQAIYDGKPWYGPSIMDVLQDVSTEQAFWRPQPGASSIAELLFHLLAWRRQFLKRVNGDFKFNIELNSTDDWTRYDTPDEAIFKQLKDELISSQSAIMAFFKDKSDAFLFEESGATDITVLHRIDGIMMHDVYHLGQMGQIKALHKKR